MRYTFGQAEARSTGSPGSAVSAPPRCIFNLLPTVSLRIKELERILGGELLRPLALPPGADDAGQRDLCRCRAHAGPCRAGAAPQQGRPARRSLLRIGAADPSPPPSCRALLAQLARRHAELQVDVTVDFSTRLEQLLLDRSIDIAFLRSRALMRGICF